MRRWFFVCLWVVLAVPRAHSQAQGLPMEPAHDSGQSISGAYEGWFQNPDGTYGMLVGYLNRNRKEEPGIPIGPNNRIDPGGSDQGQPTHFLPRRQWGVFTVTVPKDFGDKKLAWTLVTNGKTTVLPLDLNPLWEITPFYEIGMGNTPPILRFDEGGPSAQGPRPLRSLLLLQPGTHCRSRCGLC